MLMVGEKGHRKQTLNTHHLWFVEPDRNVKYADRICQTCVSRCAVGWRGDQNEEIGGLGKGERRPARYAGASPGTDSYVGTKALKGDSVFYKEPVVAVGSVLPRFCGGKDPVDWGFGHSAVGPRLVAVTCVVY